MSKYIFLIPLLTFITVFSTSAANSNGGEGFSIPLNIPELRMQQTLAESMSIIESFNNIGNILTNGFRHTKPIEEEEKIVLIYFDTN